MIGTRDQERAELRSGFEDHFKGFFPLSLGISTVAFLSFVAYRTYPDRWNGELLWNLLITSPCWLLSVGMIAGILASVLAGVTSLFWPDPFPEEKGPELMDDWERAYRDGMGDGPFEYRPEDEEPPAAPRPELRGVAERAEARISNAVTFDFTREISELRRQFSALDPAIEGILDRATAIQRKGYPLQALRILQPMADLQMSLPEDFMGVFGPLVRRFEDYLSVTELAEMHRQVSMQRLSARAFEQLAGHEKGKESPDGSSAGRTAFNDLEKAVNGFKTNFGGRAARLPAAVAARGREFVTLLDRAVGYAARGRGWYLGSLDILDEVIAQKIKEGDNGFWQCLGTEELDLLESAVMLMSRSEKRERDYGKIAGRTIFSVVLSSLAAAVIGSFFYPLSINLITFLSWFAGTAVLSWTAVGIVVLVLKLSDGIRAIPGLVKQTALKLSVWSKTSTQLKAYPLEDRAVISSVIRGLIRPDHSLEQLIREIPLIAKAAKQLNHTGHPVTLEHWARAIEILREGNDFELVWHPAQTHQGWFVDQVGYNLETQAAYSVSRSGPMSEADARREEASSNGWAGAVSDIIVDREAYLEVKPATRAEIRANGPATPNNWQMPTERFGEGKTVMVAGGAGYIGSMTSWMYHRLGYKVVVYDSLTTGHRGALPEGVTFVEGDISDGAALERAMREHQVDIVTHFAADIQVNESVTNPSKYYENNLKNTGIILEAMRKAGVRSIVFSSSAAVYGDPGEKVPIGEGDAKKPTSPYGWTKLLMEGLIQEYVGRHGFNAVALRYFNAAGAFVNMLDGQGEAFGESFGTDRGYDRARPSHIIPIFAGKMLKGEDITIFGEDYKTPDGTALRDYIHIFDLSIAHALAAKRLQETSRPGAGQAGAYLAVNLGTGVKVSNLEIAQKVAVAVSQATGRPYDQAKIGKGPRRAGDPQTLMASTGLAEKELGFKPQIGIDEIIATDVKWRVTHPEGYAEPTAPEKNEPGPRVRIRSILDWLDTVSGQGESTTIIGPEFAHRLLEQIRRDEIAKYREIKKDVFKEASEDRILSWIRDHDKDLSDALADLDAVLAKLKAPLATAYGRHYDLFNRIDALMGRMERLEASPHYAAAIRAAFLNKEFLKTQLKKARAVLDTRNHVMESYQAGEIGWLERNLESGNFLAQTLKDNVKALTNAVTKLEAEAAVRRAATSVPRFGWNKVIALAAGIWTFVFPGAAELKKQTATSPAVEREALLQKLRRQIQVDSTALDDVLSAIPGPDTRDAILKAVYDFAGPQPSAEQLNQVADWISGIDFKFRRLPEDASSFLKAGEASDRWLRALELMSGFGNFRAIWEQETAHAGVSGEWFGSYDASQPKRWHRVHLIPADVDGSVFKNPLYRGFRGDIEKFVDAPAGLLLLPPSKPLRRQASTRRVTRAEAGSERTEMRSMQSASSTSRVSDLAGPRTEMRGLWDAIRSSGVVRHALNDYRLVEIRDAASPKSSWRLVSSRTTIKPAAGQTISEHGWVAAKEAVRRLEVQAEIERGMNYFDFVDEKLQPQMRSLAAAVLRGDSWDMMRVERDLWGWTYLRRDKEVERILLLAEAHRNHRDDLTSRLVRWDKDETPEGLVQELGVYQSNFQYLLWDTLVRMGGKAIPAVWAEIQRLQPELIRRKLSPSGRDDDGVPVDEAMEDRMDAQLRFLVLVDLLSAMGDSSVLLAMISALQFRDTDTEYSHLEPTDIARYLVRFGAIAFERVEQAVTSGESDMFGTLLVSVWQQMKLMQPGAPTLAQGTLKAVQLTPEELSRQLKPGDTYSGYLNIEDNPLPQPIVVRRLTAKSYLILREVRTAPGEKETHMAVSFEEMPVDGGAYVKTGDRSVMNASNDAQFFKMAGAVMEAMGRVVTPALLTEDGNPMLRPLEAAQLIQEGREWWNARLEASERLEMRIDDAARKTRTPLQLDRQLKPGQTFSGFLEVEKEQRPWPAVVHRVAKDIYLVVREERDAKGARETRIGVSMGQVLIEASVEIIADLDLLENAGSEAQFFQAASAVIEGMAMAILEANPLRNPYANILLRGDEGVRIKDLGVDLWRIALSQPARPELRTGDTDPVLAAAETAEFFGFSERHHVPQHFSIRLDGKRYSFLLEVLDEGPGVSEFIYSGREDKLSWTGPLKVTVNPADHAFVSATHEQQMSAPIFDRIEAVLNSAAFRERWNAYEHSQAALETEPEKPRAEMRAAKTLPFGLGRTLTMEERAAAVIEVHSGGEGPGVNAFVAAVTAAREAAGKKTYGVKNGIKGLLGGGPLEENLVYLDEGMRKKIRLRGGSALGTSRVSLKTPDLSRDIRTILAENNTDAVNVEKVFKWAKSKLLTVLTDKAKVLGHIRGFEGIRAIGGGDHSEVWALLAEEGDKPRDERFKAFGELLVYLDATGKTELAAQLRGAIEALNNLYDDSEVRKPLHHTIVIYKTIDGDTVGQAEGFDSAVLTALRTIYWHIQSALDMDKQPAVVLGIMGRDVMRLAFEAARHHPRILQKLRDTSVVDQFRAYVERIDGLDALNPDLPELKSVLEELEYQKGLDLALADQIEEFAPYVLTIGQADADFYLPLQGVLNRVEQVWSEQGFFALIVSEGFSINENDPVLRDLIDPQSENYDTAIATLWWQMRESAKDLDAHGNPKLSGVEQLVRAIILAKLGPKLGKSIRDAEKIGYETRGGAVSKLDLMLGELLGAAAEKFAAQGQYGVLSIPDHSAPIPANLRLESFQNLLSRRRQTATKFNNVRNPDLYAGETFGGQPITKDNIDAFLESEGVILRDPGPYVPRGQAGVRPEMRRSSMPALRDRVRASEAWAVRVLPPEVVRFLERVWSSGGGVGIRMQTEVESLLGVRLAFAAEQAVRLPANARQIRLSQTVPVLEGGQAILAGEWPAAYQQDLQAFYNLQHRLRENRKSARDKRPVMAFVADRDIFVAGLEEAVANLKDRSLDAAEIEELRELWSGSGAPGEVRLEDLITFVHPSELKAYAAGRGAAVLHSDDSEAVEGVNLVIKPEKLKREVGDGRMVTALLSHLPFSSVSASVAARGEEPLAAADKLRKGPFEALSLTVNGRMIELTGGWNTYLQNVLESHQVIAQAA
ncbi:MAG: UDP-glucose 4-epimerase GalE [Candidatus Omnitrophota bacterium]